MALAAPLLLVYCCVWIPWRETTIIGQRKLDDVIYSLVWDAPNIYQLCYAAVPDMHLIFLRIVALTAIMGAVFIIAGLLSSPLGECCAEHPSADFKGRDRTIVVLALRLIL